LHSLPYAYSGGWDKIWSYESRVQIRSNGRVDLYYVARHRLKLHSNRLAVVAETLFGESEKTRVVGPIWTRAVAGDKEAMDYIVEHCIIDVDVLEQVFERLRGFVNLSATRWRKYGASY